MVRSIGGGVVAVVSGVVTAPVSRALATVAYVERVSVKVEHLLDESIEMLEDARPALVALTEAVDAGILDDVRESLHKLESTLSLVERVSTQVDQTLPKLDTTVHHIGLTLPLVDRTTKAVHASVPMLASLPSTQEEVRMAREAVQHLAGLLNAALEQVETLPGAKLVRRRMDKSASAEAADPSTF